MHASLGLIGRAHTVESDEIPSDDNSYTTPVINSEENKLIVSSLEDKVISLKFFQHSILKVNYNKKYHCHHFANIQPKLFNILVCYKELQRLDLISNVIYRTHELLDLISHIKQLTYNELQNLQNARKCNTSASADCRLECLRSLCENLRICFNSLTSLTSYVQSNKTIQSYLYKYEYILNSYTNVFHKLSSRLIQASQEFVSNGLLVLSHSELSRFTHDDLWEISRGIEEYNIVIDHCLVQKRFKLMRDVYQLYLLNNSLSDFNSINKLIDNQITGIRLMSFSRILYKLASERSLLIAQSVYRYFFQSSQLSDEIKDFLVRVYRRECSYSTPIFPSKSQSNQTLLMESDDYFLLFDFDSCLSKLRDLGSPVNDYLRLEYEFTSNFLDVISQSTEMLKELSSNLPKRKLHKEDTVENFMAPTSPAVVDTSESSIIKSSAFLSTSDVKVSSSSYLSINSNNTSTKPRKGVQWSDHKDISLRHQVIGRYLNVVWKMVDDMLSNAKFSSSNQYYPLPVGSWLLLHRKCRGIVSEIIKRMATKDFFPIGFIPVLQHQCKLIEHENLLLMWDRTICNSTLLNSEVDGRSKEFFLFTLTDFHNYKLGSIATSPPPTAVSEMATSSTSTALEMLNNDDKVVVLWDMKHGNNRNNGTEKLVDISRKIYQQIIECTSTGFLNLPHIVKDTNVRTSSQSNCSCLFDFTMSISSLWSVMLNMIPKLSKRLLDYSDWVIGRRNLIEIAHLLWPTVAEMKELEHIYSRAWEGIPTSRSVRSVIVGMPSDEFKFLWERVLESYKQLCQEKVNQMLEIAFGTNHFNPTTSNNSNTYTDPTYEYAQAIILTLLEPLLQDMLNVRMKKRARQQCQSYNNDDTPSCDSFKSAVEEDYEGMFRQALSVTLEVICKTWINSLIGLNTTTTTTTSTTSTTSTTTSTTTTNYNSKPNYLLNTNKFDSPQPLLNIHPSKLQSDVLLIRKWITDHECLSAQEKLVLCKVPSFLELEVRVSEASIAAVDVEGVQRAAPTTRSRNNSGGGGGGSNNNNHDHDYPHSPQHQHSQQHQQHTFIHRQTSEMSQRVKKGCAWVFSSASSSKTGSITTCTTTTTPATAPISTVTSSSTFSSTAPSCTSNSSSSSTSRSILSFGGNLLSNKNISAKNLYIDGLFKGSKSSHNSSNNNNNDNNNNNNSPVSVVNEIYIAGTQRTSLSSSEDDSSNILH